MTLTQFLFYLYHNVHEFMSIFMKSYVLTALAGTLFPTCDASSSHSGSPRRQESTTSHYEGTALVDGQVRTVGENIWWFGLF